MPRESKPAMKFRLQTLFYITAVFTAAMSVFGPAGGLGLALVVVWAHAAFSRPWAIGILVTIGLVLSACVVLPSQVGSARAAAQRNSSLRNSKQLALGMLNYEAQQGSLPPPYDVAEDGSVRHSWRTLLLPYLEEQALYNRLKLEEPWDSPANKKLLTGLEVVYFRSQRLQAQTPALDETHYLAIVDSETVWSPEEPVASCDIADGAENTILFIEVGGRATKWHEPRDLTLEEAVDILTGEFGGSEWVDPGFFISTRLRGDGLYSRCVGFADGSIRTIYPYADREVARALLTREGGDEEILVDDVETKSGEHAVLGYIVHWGRVWGLACFLFLVALPFFRDLGLRSKPDGEA